MPNATMEIAKREFLEHVLSWRFLLALVLSSLILVTSTVALSAAYKEDSDAYLSQQDDLGASEGSFARVQQEIHRHLGRPNVLSIFVGGAGDDYRAQMAGGQNDAGPLEGQRFQPEGGSSSPTNRRFDPLDLGFVAVVVMTFLVVMFSYDAVSGEKEKGTLKLMLANPIPKDSVLLGKYLGGMASVLLPFGISVVLGLATLSFLGVTLAAGAWVRMGIILLVLALLLSAFYLIGLFVSAMSRRSATSLLVLTLVWLVLVFGVGNAAAVVAKGTSPAPTSAELAEQYRAIDEETFNAWEELQEELMPLMQRQFQGGNLTPDERARLEELRGEQQDAFEEAEEKRETIRRDAMQKLDAQLARAEGFAALSPAEAFRSLSTGLARSDYWSFRDLTDAIEEYQAEVERLRQEYMEDNPTGGPMQGVMVTIGPGGMRTSGDDGFEPPEFTYAPATTSETLSSASGVRDLLVLVGANLAGFVAAYVTFLRYDVR